MRRDPGNTDFGRVPSQQLPDDLLAQVLAGKRARAIHRLEGVAIGEAGGRCPRIYRDSHPRGHRRGSDATMLSDEIDDAPASVALLRM